MIAAFFFVVLIEQLIEFAKGKWASTWTWIAWILGVAIAFCYNIDIPAEFGFVAAGGEWIGVILSGLCIGAGTTFLYDLYKKLK